MEETKESPSGGYWLCWNEWLFNKYVRNELSLLIYISSLTASTGECWATNLHFAEKFEESSVNISRKIKKLEKAGLISIEYIREWAKVKKRTVKLTSPLTKMLTHGYQNWQNTVNKNVKENSIIKNNNIKEKITKEEAENIFDYYKKKLKNCGITSFKHTKRSLSIERILKAWVKHTENDLKNIIDRYIKENRENIDKGYAKACQYFFGPAETGSKVMFYEDYISTEKEKNVTTIDVASLLI